MKVIYKIIIFFAMFQLSVLIVNTLNIFPLDALLYSNLEVENLQSGDVWTVYGELFTFDTGITIPYLGTFNEASVDALMTMFIVGGVVVSIFTRNPSLIAVAVIGYLYVPIIVNSFDFFRKIFLYPDVPSVTYLGVSMGVGILIIAVITIIEMTTHGRSGS